MKTAVQNINLQNSPSFRSSSIKGGVNPNDTDNPRPLAISVTNFDLSSVYLLRPEILVTLNNAEKHLSEFNDDEEQAPLLLDSVTMLKQLAAIFELLDLSGSSQLADVLADCMQQLYNNGDNSDEALIISISQGIMTLSRYIEFILLKETLEPSLLLPIINQLNKTIGRQPIKEQDLISNDYNHITLANPSNNFQSLEDLGLNDTFLSTAYRAGLNVALTAKSKTLSTLDTRKLNAMFEACSIIASKTQVLFWSAAKAATKNMSELLPLTEKQKRIFIFIDQQFHNYLPADDTRFADLVSFACLRENELAKQVRDQLRANHFSDEQLTQFKRFMFGPNQEIATTLNLLIQDEIDTIKGLVDTMVNDLTKPKKPNNNDEVESSVTTKDSSLVDKDQIIQRLLSLASTLKLLDLNNVSETLKSSAKEVSLWNKPSPEDLDKLLNHLMVAENAAITLSKSHTPGAHTQQLNNNSISIYQLDTAYKLLLKESRSLITNLETTINDYLFNLSQLSESNADKLSSVTDIQVLKDTPIMLKEIAGALRFLDLTDAANIINHLSLYLNDALTTDNKLSSLDDTTYLKFSKIADVILAIDHQLSTLQKNHPLGKHAMHIGNTSLYKLLAA